MIQNNFRHPGANAVNLTELKITSRAAETQCMGLEDISAEEATIDYNCSSKHVVAMYSELRS